jgi:dTDP-4-dehydrorhamnose reductase
MILRTSWAYSPHRTNFVKTILRLAAERDRLTVVADQRGCPTAARDIAKACRDVALRCASAPGQAPYGVYHFAGAGEASWFELAAAIIDIRAVWRAKSPQVVPVRSADYPTRAARPLDSRLDCSAIVREFGVSLRPWREALEETIDRLLANKDVP